MWSVQVPYNLTTKKLALFYNQFLNLRALYTFTYFILKTTRQLGTLLYPVDK